MVLVAQLRYWLVGLRFRTTGNLRRLQLLLAVVHVPLQFLFLRYLGFGLTAQLNWGLQAANYLGKSLGLHVSLDKDDHELFMFLRGIPDAEARSRASR